MRKLRMLAYELTVLIGVWFIGATIVGAQVKSQDRSERAPSGVMTVPKTSS